MKLKFILLTFLLFISGISILKSQVVYNDYVDGAAYVKVMDTSALNLDPYDNSNLLLNAVIASFGIDSMKKAFVTPNPLLDKIYRIHFTDSTKVDSLLMQLNLIPSIDYAEKVVLYHLSDVPVFLPNDLDAAQWGLVKVNATTAWDYSQGSPSIKVAVVDNAVRLAHEDLTSQIWTNPGEIPGNFLDDDLNGYPDDVNGWDAANFDNNPNPPSGLSAGSIWNHGSHCSGIVSASTNNAKGIASLGFNLSIIPVKSSLDISDGSALTHSAEGIDYAISAGADVISMSFGSEGSSLTSVRVIQTAAAAGIVLVGASGNNNSSTIFYPAGYPEVISVGSTNSIDEKSSFSNYGAWIDVMAPGSMIRSTMAYALNEYGDMSGTSMACPLVASLAGLILSVQPTLTPANVKDFIVNGCENIDALNLTYIGQLGAGRINAANSLTLLSRENPVEAEIEVLKIYPNPCNEQIFVSAKTDSWEGDIYWKIFSVNGQVLLSGILPGRELETFRFNVADLAQGFYFLELKDETRTIRSNFIK